MNEETRLVRYQVLAANRRHFSCLFFAVVAFSWSFGLAIWVVAHWAKPDHLVAAFLASGAMLTAGAFVAGRLLKRERSSFEAMTECWRNIAGEESGPAGRKLPGAMAIVVMGQFLSGALLLLTAAILA